MRRYIRRILGIHPTPIEEFLSFPYLRKNQRMLEHLASLGLDIAGSKVLEVGAGIGDHTSFFLDRGCSVVSIEPRQENIKVLLSRCPDLTVKILDLDDPDDSIKDSFDIVYCYGLLYHLTKPAEAIRFMSNLCRKMLLVQTCVSFSDEESIDFRVEDKNNPSQSIHGMGCLPSRKWVCNKLRKYFEFVYITKTQPNHEQFPLDWTKPPITNELARAIFIASREELSNDLLIEGIPMHQVRH